MEMDRLLILAVGLVAAAVGRPQETPSTPPTPQRPSFSGRWHFNASQSDDARAKMREAMAGRRSGGDAGGGSWGGHRGGGGGGGYGGRGGRRGGDDHARGAQDGDGMHSLVEAPEQLTITQTEGEIAILDKDGLLRTLHPDGQKYKAEAGASEVKTWWEQAHLRVETKRDPGPKITETYGLSADGKQIVVDVSLEGHSGVVAFRRIYDAVQAE